MKKCLILFLLLCLTGLLMTGCSESSEANADGIDVDLSALSSTMLSAQYNNIMTSPNRYIGKTIKVRGSYAAFFSEAAGGYRHYVITKEGDDCCTEGFEFIWSGEHEPLEEGVKIEAVGVFSSYEEAGRTWYYLAVDELSVLSQ